MKKALIIITIVVAALAAAGIAALYLFESHYEGIDAAGLPVPAVTIAGQEVKPLTADALVPVLPEWQERFPGLTERLRPRYGQWLEKPLVCSLSSEEVWETVDAGGGGLLFSLISYSPSLGLLGEAPYEFDIQLPMRGDWSIVLNGEGVSAGVVIEEAGDYLIEITGSIPKESLGGIADAVFYYRAVFAVDPPPVPDPVFTAGREDLQQGDILSLKLEFIPDGVVPEVETALGAAVFTRGLPASGGAGGSEGMVWEGVSDWYAAVPVSNSQKPGVYEVFVRAGELNFEAAVTVSEYDFDFQNMIIDTSVPSVAAATTADAAREFREKVSVLMPLFSEERYWDGVFIRPVEMRENDFISTQFGEIRITNGNENTRRSHLGMDYAVPPGTPVHASGAGMVLVSEFLLNTGNTVVIDHGGGLKSYYYHMESVEDLAGTVIERGALIGHVGSTGYSTGPHLHFEMRIGEIPISPSMLLEPKAGLYSAQ